MGSEPAKQEITCTPDPESGQQVCKLKDYNDEGKVENESVVKADVDNDGNVNQFSFSGVGHDESEIEDLKEKTREEARENFGSGGLAGDIERA